MIFWKTIDVADRQRVLVYVRNQFKKVLMPGRHRVSTFEGRLHYEVHDVTDGIFNHKDERFLLSQYQEQLSPYLEKFAIHDNQVGVVYRDGNIADILAPGSLLTIWKGIADIRVDVIDIDECYQIPAHLTGLLGRGVKVGQIRNMVNAVVYSEVANDHVGLLSVNGKLERLLSPGSYGFWKYNRSVVVKQLDLRLQSVDITGQEILTKDRVSLRINLLASYKIKDPQRVVSAVSDYAALIYRELQLSLREAVGTQTLDALLENKDYLNTHIADNSKETLSQYGIELVDVGVKDIILPGEMKQILNQVVEAQKEAEANLIKRREETQAVRSLHNTAKVMENNPVLLRLKELEVLERVTGKINHISVYGGLDGVMNELVSIAPKKA